MFQWTSVHCPNSFVPLEFYSIEITELWRLRMILILLFVVMRTDFLKVKTISHFYLWEAGIAFPVRVGETENSVKSDWSRVTGGMPNRKSKILVLTLWYLAHFIFYGYWVIVVLSSISHVKGVYQKKKKLWKGLIWKVN